MHAKESPRNNKFISINLTQTDFEYRKKRYSLRIGQRKVPIVIKFVYTFIISNDNNYEGVETFSDENQLQSVKPFEISSVFIDVFEVRNGVNEGKTGAAIPLLHIFYSGVTHFFGRYRRNEVESGAKSADITLNYNIILVLIILPIDYNGFYQI